MITPQLLNTRQLADTTHLTDVDYRQIGKSIQQLKNIKNADAKRFITFIASNYKVIMLNEAYNKPLHRAFAYSLLDILYNRGFRYLAMEMLNPMPDQELTKLTYKTGHFATEPVAGELIRQALELGFKLVAYEDPHGRKTFTHRKGFHSGIQYCQDFKTGSGSKNFCVCRIRTYCRKKYYARFYSNGYGIQKNDRY